MEKQIRNESSSENAGKLPLPIGISDYRKACSEYYYVDKTLLIRDFNFNNECVPRAFWQSTGNNDLIREALEGASEEILDGMEALMQGKSLVTYIDTGVIYPHIQKSPSSVYSLLLVAGYLKALTNEQTFGGDYMCEVALPNREISYVYSREILSLLEHVIPASSTIAVQKAIYTMDVPALQKWLEAWKKTYVSEKILNIKKKRRRIMNKETISRIRKFREDRDWNQFHTPSNLAKSIVIEAAELLECFQWSEEEYDLQHVKEELADVLVYCQDMLDSLGLDVDEIVNMKMDQNERKYPVEKARGNSLKYDKL